MSTLDRLYLKNDINKVNMFSFYLKDFIEVTRTGADGEIFLIVAKELKFFTNQFKDIGERLDTEFIYIIIRL